ncbi:hypothetical protein HNR63_001116 [Anoxybacillus kamchatkensis]|uniref:hypothetical protein n=1 Tax=Anoxybacillus ayderensis TaxID=265546 RepID=UPI0017966DF4|nr:hypothetical protein [Anoxybacillus ayderensis]MBA2878062.1 hypothetical protein [Anoxybacillus ayderensis]
MPFDQNQLPTWNKEGVEPPQSLKDDGWQPSQKPPADYFNWFFNKTFKALQSLFTNAQHKDEKGQPNGYAALNAEGKVVNADGSLAGGVQSVNNKTGAVILTASDVGAETPAGAQAKADQAEADANNYTDQQLAAHLVETASKFTNINLNIIDMAVELETLKGATLNGVTANIFVETFQNLADINLMNGIYDSTNKRLAI